MKKLIAIILASAPVMAFAQPITDINTISSKATNIGNLVVQLAISLAVVWIIVSVVRYLILGAASEEKRKAGRDSIIYGVIGLFVILSIWGLVYVLTNSFRTTNGIPTTELNRQRLVTPDNINNTGTDGTNGMYDAPTNWGQQNANGV